MKLVIFDLDDTLIDFASTRQVAYTHLARHVAAHGIDAQAFIQACSDVDRPLFSMFEQGRITREEYRIKRFSEPFAVMGLGAPDGLVGQLNKIFMDCVNDTPLLYDDVLPTLARLRAQDVRMAILTNGPSDGQRRKLRATGLGEMVDHVAIGEEVGFSKPLARAFHSVVERFAFERTQTLMVGDSPELDYDAALNAGLAALLLDREQRHSGGHRSAIRSINAVG